MPKVQKSQPEKKNNIDKKTKNYLQKIPKRFSRSKCN